MHLPALFRISETVGVESVRDTTTKYSRDFYDGREFDGQIRSSSYFSHKIQCIENVIKFSGAFQKADEEYQRSAKDLLRSMLSLDPTKRPSVDALLKHRFFVN